MNNPIEYTDTFVTKASWRDFFELCKPRVVLLMLLTAIVGMCLAAPGKLSWQLFLFGNLGIGLAAGAAAAINHIVERHLDKLMRRTERRPLAQGKVSPQMALLFALFLAIASMLILITLVNILTAILTFMTLIGYAFIYTLYLKHATPQNIVIGGLAGAAPPLLGWVAITNHIDAGGLLLVLIIFVWTPPHFWALAIARIEDYASANIPMLPNTHGIAYTKLNVLLYTLLLSVTTLLPFVIGLSGWIYLVSTVLLNIVFIYWAIKLYKKPVKVIAMNTFFYSIWYLMLLFFALLVDHYFYLWLNH